MRKILFFTIHPDYWQCGFNLSLVFLSLKIVLVCVKNPITSFKFFDVKKWCENFSAYIPKLVGKNYSQRNSPPRWITKEVVRTITCLKRIEYMSKLKDYFNHSSHHLVNERKKFWTYKTTYESSYSLYLFISADGCF